jgi:hypothetical protein
MKTNEELLNGMTKEELARKAVLNIVGLMTVKWVVIFGVTRVVRKMVEKA